MLKWTDKVHRGRSQAKGRVYFCCTEAVVFSRQCKAGGIPGIPAQGTATTTTQTTLRRLSPILFDV